AIVPDHPLRAGAQIGVQLRHEPVIPDLVSFRPVQMRVSEMLVDVAPHLQRQLGRQEAVDDDQRRAWHPNTRARNRTRIILSFPPPAIDRAMLHACSPNSLLWIVVLDQWFQTSGPSLDAEHEAPRTRGAGRASLALQAAAPARARCCGGVDHSSSCQRRGMVW